MGGCLQKCCLSQPGTICCNIISILGVVYFVLMWAIFQSQFTFFEFHIPNKQDTRLSCIVSALIYLLFFIWTLYRLMKINRQKKQALERKHKASLEMAGNNIPSVYSADQEKNANRGTERMLREQQQQ